MVRAIVVHFIGKLLDGHAVLASLVRPMHSLAFRLHLRQEMFKAFMLDLQFILVSHTIGAFFIRPMMALVLDISD